jgi:hypothetical protein
MVDDVLQHRLARDGQQRLRLVQRQRIKPGGVAGGEDAESKTGPRTIVSLRPKPKAGRNKVAIKTKGMPDVFPAHEGKGRSIHKRNALIGKFFHPWKRLPTNPPIDGKPSYHLTGKLSFPSTIDICITD